MNSRDRELSKLYEATWAKVKSAVDAADPQGLLALGSPDDEYDDVVAYLVRPVARGEQVDSVALQDWFRSVYGGEGNPETVERLVEEMNRLSRTSTVPTH
ncbi:MAG TPA: hypothetical protein VII96_05490 [Acidimicrobiales bacterium]